MKILKTLIPALIFASGIHSAAAQGISFAHGSWSTVLQKAKNSGKFIFVDFYATWCGPCIQMSREVFTDPEVGDYFNKHFISWKIDAEKEEEDLVNAVNLEAYPTLVFFNPNGDVLYKHVGAMDTHELMELGKKVADFETNKAKALKGAASQKEILHYLSIAKSADRENYKRIAQEAVKKFTAEDLADYDAWDILTTNVSDITSPAFQNAIAAGDVLAVIHENYYDYVKHVLDRYFTSVSISGNLEDLEVYKKSIQLMFKNLAGRDYDYRYFDLRINADYYLRRHEMDNYAQALSDWVDSYVFDDWKLLSETALNFSHEIEYQQQLGYELKDKQYKEKAIQWARKAVDIDRNKDTLYNLAKVYEYNGRKKDAIKWAKEILKFDLTEDELMFIETYITDLES